jgi:ABC-2 type transport system permease protein
MTELSLTRTTGLARYNALLLSRNKMAMLYGVALPLAPLALLLATPDGSGAATIATTLTMAALFPVYYNVLSQFVNRRDELVLKRLRTGETSDAELLASIALPGVVLALGVMLVTVPVAVALGEPVPLNPVVYAVTGLVTMLLFTAFAFWTAAWTRNAEAAQLTSGPIIVLAVVGQMSVAFPESAQRWLDLTPGAAMADLVRTGWFGIGDAGTERTLDFADTWAAAGQPLLVLLAWTALAVWLAARSMHWEPRT